MQAILTSNQGLKLSKIRIPGISTDIYCDTATPITRPYMPKPLRRQVLQSLHDLTQSGTRASARLIAQRYIWPQIQKDCSAWTRVIQCQRGKISRYNAMPFGTFQKPIALFEHIHMDIIGLLPLSNGYKYCLTIVDRYIRWPEATLITDITAEIVTKFLFTEWITQYGTPTRITTDQGRQFEADSLPTSDATFRISTPPNNNISSDIERDGRTLPPSTQGSNQISPNRRMNGNAANNPDEHKSCTQRRLERHNSRISV